MTLQITKVNAPQDKLKKKAPYSMDPIGTTTHETGNIATAMAEISYMLGNNSSTGYHFAVDDTRAVQGLPLNRNAFHSGDGSTGRGNRKTIGVEHCYNWNGKKTTKNDKKYNPLYQKAIKNGIELQAQLFIQHPQWGEPKAGVNMFRHYDHNRKNCPQRIIEEGYWNTYVALVRARYLELKGVKAEPVKAVVPKPIVEPVVKNPESIVDYLKLKKEDSSFTNRKKIATAHGIKNYSGTADQNEKLLASVKKNGIKPNKVETKPATSSYKGDSIVDYLNSIKVDPSPGNRKKLAAQYGIKNYTGTASQNTALLNAMRNKNTSKAKSSYKGNSLVDYLKSIKVDSSPANRKKIAAKYGIKNYKGTAAQNLQLLNKMR